MVDAVGIEPTTCRLRARHLPFSPLLSIALCYSLSADWTRVVSPQNCDDYPQPPRIFNQSTHKSPHSVFDPCHVKICVKSPRAIAQAPAAPFAFIPTRIHLATSQTLAKLAEFVP